MAPYDLARVRENLPLLREWTYLNTGSYGVMAEPVLEKHLARLADFERGGQATIGAAIEGYERARAAVARLIGADAGQIALCRNASDGANLVAAGFPLESGDELITFAEENGSFVLAWNEACRRSGARQQVLPVTHLPGELAASVRQALTQRTRVISVSQVVADTGVRVPIELIRELAGPGVAVVIDAAQSIGQLPVDVSTLVADFVIGNGHKWLCGPKGTGFVWFSPAWMERVPPVFVGYETVEPRFTRAEYLHDPPPPLRLPPSARRYEFGTLNWHHFGALADAIEYLDGLGWDAIWEWQRQISTRAKQRIGDLPGVSLLTPESWEHSSGMFAIVVADGDSRAISWRLLEDWRITQRGMERPGGLRFSCAYFTSDEDIERLVEALGQIFSVGRLL